MCSYVCVCVYVCMCVYVCDLGAIVFKFFELEVEFFGGLPSNLFKSW